MTRSLTRRALLGRASAGALALAALPSLARGQERLGPRPLARAVALGPGGIGVEQSYAANRNRFIDTGTPWVRLWADWPRVQPVAGLPPDLSELDAAVALAKADGLRVMVTAWRFAPWAGAPLLVPPGRDITFGVARDLSPRGAWARWIELLMARYAGHVDALEIVNEPNLQLWPQAGIDDAVATMFETAAAIAPSHPGAPLLVGPATADVADSASATGYLGFTRELLDRLDERGFRPGARFAWSHHAYTDVEQDRAGAENGVAQVRTLLTARWAGSAPAILITESGARVDVVGGRARQAELLRRNARRMLVGPEGEGVAMLGQYLFVSDANYDSGLCDLDGTPRPAYRAWSDIPAGR